MDVIVLVIIKMLFIDEDDEPILKTERKRKSTSDSPKKKTSPKKAKGPKVKEEKKSKKEKAVKKEKKEKKLKEPKAKKPKIDKSNPNWRLKPNLSVQVYEKVQIKFCSK